MASQVDICNLALSRIGEDGSITSLDPPEGSEQVAACKAFYQRALLSLLEEHDWGFATLRNAPGKLADVPTYGWRDAYALPRDCARVISVNAEADLRHRFRVPSASFEIESIGNQRVLLTDVEFPIVRYVTNNPNPGSFTSLFADALAWRLAMDLCGRVIKSKEGMTAWNACYKAYQLALGDAKKKDFQEKNKGLRHIPTWIRVR